MQDVQLHIGGSLSVSGTITFSTSSTLSDNNNNFTSHPWIIGQTIVNNTNGKIATVLSVASSTSIVISMSVTSFGQGTDSFTIIQDLQLADTFKDETISLTQSIKNIKDIGKIQTNFTKSFTLPASKTNNKIFKHFYRGDVSDGFDSRFLTRAKIKLNGIDFQDGKIRLLGVKMKNNKPSSYKVSFVGNTVSLKTAFGDDELTDLPYLDVFNHTYSYSNIKTYMQDGFHLGTPNLTYPDMMYPFISCKNRYYLDTSETGSSSGDEIEGVRNIYNPNPNSVNAHNDYKSILFTDLKPSIKVKHILTAIEQKYGFTFSDDFFDPPTAIETAAQFEQLYMFCNREAGSLSELVEETSHELKLEDFTNVLNYDLREDNNTSLISFIYTTGMGGYNYKAFLTYAPTISFTGGGLYDLEIYDVGTEQIYYSEKNISDATKTVSVTLITRSTWFDKTTVHKPAIRVKTKGGITSFEVTSLSVIRYYEDYNNQNNNVTTYNIFSESPITLSNGVDFRNKMLPKIKVFDFLTNIFKMFNLVAYFEDTELVVKTLNQYYLYSGHEDFYIDDYVDSSSFDVNRSEVYNEINYEYEKPKTIFAIQSNEATNDEYGNERFKSEGDTVFDGKKYDVKVNFGHMLYENIVDQDTGEFSDVLWSYSVNQDESPVVEKATLFYGRRSDVYTNLTYKYYVTDKPVGDTSGSYTNDVINHLYRPSNTYVTLSNNKHSINFGEEYDSLTNLVEPDSLFKIYHQNFITNIYNTQTRILKITAHLPLKILLNYKLNDRFIVRGKRYLINSIKTNLQTGKSELELLTDNYGQ